jgi:CP family cyanate transporter-like MFS transporter
VASASLSAFTQGAGYLVAAPGPLAIGFLHTATGSWTIPIVILLAILAAELVVGWPAGRPATLPEASG